MLTKPVEQLIDLAKSDNEESVQNDTNDKRIVADSYFLVLWNGP